MVGAEGVPGVLRKRVRHPERLTQESLDWIHADLERMLELAEYHARIGTLNPLLESEETDAEAQGNGDGNGGGDSGDGDSGAGNSVSG